jgi:sec-independent protein translocase protein TatC
VAAETESPQAVEAKMPMMRHLREMRDRVAKSVIAMVITTGLAFAFGEQLLEILIAPAPPGLPLIAIELTENLAVFLKVSLAGGFILAMPFLIYQLFAFISPALTSKEKSYIYRIIPFIAIMFFAGVAFAYFVGLPPALNFLTTWNTDIAEPQIRINDYVNVVTRMIISVGFVFETPVIIMFLARMGIVTPQWLARRRKLWIVLAFVLAAFITPTIDPIVQTIIALPLILLLELSIILSKFVYKDRSEPAPEEA